MKFMNRTDEMSRLDKVINSKEGGLIAIWGRSRIGKTRLLLEWTKKHKGVYGVANESAATIQRDYLARTLENVFPGFSNVQYQD